MRILLLEDDLNTARYILKGLEEEGHTVDHLADGRDAVAQAVAENYDVIEHEHLLPLGLALDCTIRRPVERDTVLTFADVDIPQGRLVDALYAEQSRRYAPSFLSAAE